MAKRSGSADLPLHGGRVPPWLGERMARLGRVVVEALVLHYGRDELLRRLSHPFWFQSLGAVMGMDWHSSGITTSVVSALKRGLAPLSDELGIYVCGGRGRHSRRTPAELADVSARLGLDGDALARTSRLVAKVDSAAVQDGFALYLHAFFVTADGRWAVVQQGMREQERTARRYHWLSETIDDFVDEPHSAIAGAGQGVIVNLVDHRARRARELQVQLVAQGPGAVLAALREAAALPEPAPILPHLQLPAHHEVREEDVVLRRLHGTLAAAAEAAPERFDDLLLAPGVGARTVAALAMVAEVIHGAPCRFSDPARFALAHGGKDGHPYPVPLEVYDRTLAVYRRAIEQARLGQDDKLAALRHLAQEGERLERAARGPSLSEHVASERALSPSYGGMSVMGPAGAAPRKEPVRPWRAPTRARRSRTPKGQLKLPNCD